VAELTVMTWNVQNLLPVGHPDGPATDGEYRAKLAAVAEVIDAVAPDVVALQEVGSAQVLADLTQERPIDFDHRLTGGENRRGIRVALLSPRRLSRRRDRQQFPPGVLPVQYRDNVFDPATSTTTSRGILSATVRSGAETVTVITCPLEVEADHLRP
jgi:endonuclease/exonuclease/phosphatase family metal-dependent hydrolase